MKNARALILSVLALSFSACATTKKNKPAPPVAEVAAIGVQIDELKENLGDVRKASDRIKGKIEALNAKTRELE